MRRVVISILAAMALTWAAWQAARAGFARALAERASVGGDLNSAARAVQLSPSDAETHIARGDLLQRTENYVDGALELESAVRLRPRDYYLWLLLGVARDEAEDQEGALRALEQAVALAPSYALPRWQIGNLLLRMGRPGEAFTDLRLAANSNANLWANVIDLAWGFSNGEPQSMIQLLQPQTDGAHLAVALFLVRHDRVLEAAEQYRSAGSVPDPMSKTLLDELLRHRAFVEAYQVWARMHHQPEKRPVGAIDNGSFEEPLTLDEKGFGWRVSSKIANVRMSLDESEHHTGSRSLRIDFGGDSNPGLPVVSQIILVEPQTQYRLTFAARSRDFVSGSTPVISINDLSDPNGRLLAQSVSLASENNAWREYSVDLTTSTETRAIEIMVTRVSCPQEPCPAFGTVWLDSFVLY